MALATQSANLVWQKVSKALAGASPAAQDAFKALKVTLANQEGNPDLQFLAWTESGALAASGTGSMASSTGGVAGIAGSGTLYGVWAKKTGAGTTPAYFKVFDGTDNTVAATGSLVQMKFTNQDDERFYIDPVGVVFQTDITVSSLTGGTGVTETTGASDSQVGFIIIGAANATL